MDDIAIDEPLGFADLQLSIIRDSEYHGIGFEASTGTIEFYGEAAEYLRNKKETEGIAANVVFRAESVCNAYQEEENVYTGRVNFGLYKEKCGDSCTVTVGLEEDSCIVVLRNREDQQVDIDSLVAFDKMTALEDYAMMGEEIELLGQDQLGLIEGSVEGTQEINFNGAVALDADIIFRPTYDAPVSNNIRTGNLTTDYTSEVVPHGGFTVDFPTPLSPQLLNEEQARCFDGIVEYSFRMKGSFNITASGPSSGESLISLKMIIGTWNGEGEKYTDLNILDSVTIPYSGSVDGVTISGTFDETIPGNATLTEGVGLYCYIAFEVSAFLSNYVVNVFFDEESNVEISGNRICPPTTAEYYMVHETLSRAVESITNGCARVKSSYYGRTESQPFSFEEDGCGSLRMFTSGLKIRKADKDYFFASFKKLIDGLNAIDNIGFGLEDDPVIPNKKVVVVENVDHFYQADNVILTLPVIPSALNEVQEEMYVSKVMIGYKHWEVETINGLDEINSTREYRTAFDNVSRTLDITSDLVAGAYAIELTRQQSFIDSGGADTSYDNETFIICLRRQGYNTFIIDTAQVQGSPQNIYSPSTKYNINISPARNMIRWLKSTLNGYPNIADSTSKIYFASGTGNIDAVIGYVENVSSDLCYSTTDVIISEKQDLNFSTPQEDVEPIWKNETITFDYPLSVGEYKAVKAAPYGVVRYQCGQGRFQDGFIKEIKYQPVSGTATFTLIKKY